MKKAGPVINTSRADTPAQTLNIDIEKPPKFIPEIKNRIISNQCRHNSIIHDEIGKEFENKPQIGNDQQSILPGELLEEWKT
jgi:hypothetical protein